MKASIEWLDGVIEGDDPAIVEEVSTFLSGSGKDDAFGREHVALRGVWAGNYRVNAVLLGGRRRRGMATRGRRRDDEAEFSLVLERGAFFNCRDLVLIAAEPYLFEDRTDDGSNSDANYQEQKTLDRMHRLHDLGKSEKQGWY